jgi:HTH-type transcriptional regulator / antitoxin HigA
MKHQGMELKPIRTRKEHQVALAEASRLWDAAPKSPEADRLDVLTMLINAYRLRRDEELAAA